MNMPLVLLNRRRRGGAFSPTRLFALAEPGVWYDPSDLTTLFQDTAGTTPVTTPGQTVARVNDKSGRGNHATQATAASRPTYGIVPRTGRRNLLTRTEEFNDAVWVKTAATVTANAAVAPDGAATADLLVETASTNNHRVSQSAGTLQAQDLTVSIRYKASVGTRNLDLALVAGSAFVATVFSTTTGAVLANNDAVGSILSGKQNGTSGPDTNGYYTATISVTLLSSQTVTVIYGLANGTSNNYLGDGTSGILIWGAQLETGSTATNYQRVGSAFDVTEAGVPSLSYLSFDGVDDFLVTPTITPGVDKAQVFAGVRHLSNANYGALTSFGTTVADQGSLLTWLRSSGGGGQFEAYAKGSSSATTGTVTGTAALTVPATSVFSTIYDIAQSSVTDEIRVRQNGAAMSVAGVSSAGTGNFSAWPMNIGQYNGTHRLNANIFSLIVRFGANLDANTITNTETWVNSKTGAY